MFARVLACAGLLSTAGTAAAAKPKQPTGKWIVNFADAQCVATRNYGSNSDPIYLVLKAPAFRAFSAATITPALRRSRTRWEASPSSS